MAKPVAFRGPSLYFFLGGVGVLFVVPFLTWYSYGLNFLFPAQVSMVWLFEHGFRSLLVLYLGGVAATIVWVAALRRPDVLQGIFPAVFPLWTFSVLVIQSYTYGYQGYEQILTPGMFGALAGSVLLEASYFCYRIKRGSEIPINVQNESFPVHGATDPTLES